MRLLQNQSVSYGSRVHFFIFAAKLMRRILVDHARSKGYAKRGGNAERVSLDEGMAVSGKQAVEVVALDEALKDLEVLDPRKSKIVEMRYFGGLAIDETAEALGISTPTVEREWRSARAWLHRAIRTRQIG